MKTGIEQTLAFEKGSLIEFLGGWLINHILKMDTQIEKTEQ